MPTLLKMDGLYLYTSSVNFFLVNPFSRLQKISKHVSLCTRAPRIRKCFHPRQNYDDVTPNRRIVSFSYISYSSCFCIYKISFDTYSMYIR